MPKKTTKKQSAKRKIRAKVAANEKPQFDCIPATDGLSAAEEAKLLKRTSKAFDKMLNGMEPTEYFEKMRGHFDASR